MPSETPLPASTETPAFTDAAGSDPDRIHLHMPVDVRSTSLAVLAVVACGYALHAASDFVIPLLLGLLLSYALSPLVDGLERWHIPRALGAAALLLAALAGLGATGYALADDATALAESLPDAAQKLRESVRKTRSSAGTTIEQVQKAATKLEQAAEESGAAAPPATKGVTRVQIERPRFNVKDYLWTGTLGLVGLVGQAAAVWFITYFLLVSGDSFRRKMVSIAGPRLSQKKVTLQVLDEITQQIRRYLVVQVFVSVIVGAATWGVLAWMGLERALVWGVAAAALNLVPYIGAVVIAAGLALVAFLQFGELDMALLAAGASLFIHVITGNLLTPWLTSRTSRVNPVVVFVGVIAWGWLWGIWGLLLGAPLLMAIKAVCDRVDELKPIGELLGR
ncbi:MAG TPA: AI-2E family transporter [Rubrivivax sp.]